MYLLLSISINFSQNITNHLKSKRVYNLPLVKPHNENLSTCFLPFHHFSPLVSQLKSINPSSLNEMKGLIFECTSELSGIWARRARGQWWISGWDWLHSRARKFLIDLLSSLFLLSRLESHSAVNWLCPIV